MNTVDTIQAIYDVLGNQNVPSTEVLDLLGEAGDHLGECLSTIGLLVTAEQNPQSDIWLARKNGQRLCTVHFIGEEDYKLTVSDT